MNPVTSLILTMGLLLGCAGGFYAFEHASRSDAAAAAAVSTPTTTDMATPAPQPARHAHRRQIVRWAPCAGGATLVEGVCVTDVVKTVTLPAPAGHVATAASHPSSGGSSAHGGEHEGGEGEHGERGDHGGGGEGGGHDD